VKEFTAETVKTITAQVRTKGNSPCVITIFSENPRKFMKYNTNINTLSDRQKKATNYTTMCHMKINQYTLLTQAFHTAYDFFIPDS